MDMIIMSQIRCYSYLALFFGGIAMDLLKDNLLILSTN